MSLVSTLHIGYVGRITFVQSAGSVTAEQAVPVI